MIKKIHVVFNMADTYHLTILVFTPLFASIIAFFISRWFGDKAVKVWTILVTGFNFLYSSALLLTYYADMPAAGGFMFVEKRDWIVVGLLQVKYYLAVDGLSMPLVALTGFIFFISAMTSYYVEKRAGDYMVMLLMLETGVMGTFMALDLFLFYIFWELVLVPMFFLIGVWGGPRRVYAAFKFFIYTHFASLFMLIGLIAATIHAYLRNPENVISLDLLVIHEYTKNLPGDQWWVQLIFLAMFFGFIVKIPSVPFHTWLPDAHVEAPSPISAILAGLLLKMGGYGVIRFAIFLLPTAFKTEFLRIVVATFGVVSVVWGALAALSQVDLKRLIAYSSISHMGYVLLGLAVFTEAGINGAMYQMISHGIISPLLFLISGTILHGVGTRDIPKLGGLPRTMPITAVALIYGSFASAGLPGLSGFWAEFTVFVGAFAHVLTPGESFTAGYLSTMTVFVVIAVIAVIITAGYYLWAVQRVVFGPMSHDVEHAHHDAPWYDWISFALLSIFILFLGVYPTPLMNILNNFTSAFVNL